MIIVDTDIFIDNFRGLVKAKNFFERVIESDKGFYFSVITEAELLSGEECNDKLKMDRVLQLFSLGKKLVIDNRIAKSAGELRRQYNLALDDCFIGATALEHNAILITRNISDFKKIKGLSVRMPY